MLRTSLLTLAALASCGGDSAVSDDDQATVQQASDKQAEAIALAPASPCNAVAQCANLNFVIPTGTAAPRRSTRTRSPRLASPRLASPRLASPTAAAASAAAAQEQTLALHAVDIAPPPPQACAASIELPPRLACVANTCQVALPGS